MKKRRIAWRVRALGVAACLAAGTVLAETPRDFDPIAMVNCHATLLTMPVHDLAKVLRTFRDDYGLRRFAMDAPGLFRYFGTYDRALHVRIGEALVALKRELADTDIELCWWDRTTIGWAHHESGHHIVDCDGNSSNSLCPLDDAANAPFLDHLVTCASIARPTTYLIEDDYNLSGHAGIANPHGGCFCPLHLAEFAKRVGKSYAAKEIGGFFDVPTPENESLRRAFVDVSRESLAHFAKRIRGAVDKVTPESRILLCQSAQVDLDGDTTEANARAFAGATRPLVRIYGSAYFSQNVPEDLPKTLAHTVYSAQHLPRDIQMVYEADTFPHSLFYNSTLFYESEIAAGMMAGADDLLILCVQSSDNLADNVAYARMFRENRRRFAVVRDFRSRSSLVGVRAVYDAGDAALVRTRGTGMLDESARVLAKFGIPMTTLPSAASVLFGDTPRWLSEEKLREVFRGSVIVDSTAAQALQKRGFGAWLGCSVKSGEDDLEFLLSRTLPVKGARVTGANRYDYRILEPATPVPGWDLKTDYVRIVPGKETETWVRYEDAAGREVSPSFVVSPNPLGGRTGVLSFGIKGNFREWLYTASMQDVFRNFFAGATGGQVDVVATHTPSTWLMAAVSNDGQELLVMVNNLAGEPRDDILLEFAERWRGGKVLRLGSDGMWTDVGRATDSFAPVGGLTYAAMKPEFFRVVKQSGR